MEGNNKAMREALEFADEQLRRATEDDRYGADLVYLVGCMRTVATACRAALSEPPRQCDVGTAEEQDARLWSYCAETRCGDTLCRNGNCSPEDIRMCALRWAQMPYEEGGAK